MKREIIITGDGSSTIHIPEWNEQYHSKHGALQEARHVFIDMGLIPISRREDLHEISILEIGFGTGLNALVTWEEAQNLKKSIDYNGVEAYPVAQEEVEKLNFSAIIKDPLAVGFFDKIHESEWEKKVEITKYFSLTKQQKFFQEIEDTQLYNLIYFDAFGARVQPELWSVEILRKMYNALKNNGVLVTYAAKGSVRRAMLEVGFLVERLPGPPGKREMLRATKNI
ncbi:tRNA U34 5-methylaminomethyl-2-thiouridine-forming methyltransferase MnmC [Gillisia sp. Hel_I_86]|uniref:tRNA (5-methylaminomethyl-2-thiouridine)(34)-methyltransferase MnmD n=1 Tax=Gillisia sp. Hel_I_86 TaxID=1249981 RepID=UPI00119B206C|nr:tRNA (5-methylaminomethyl-2-thiouridine)(34)-methyltransferase MnmD [Gillisia sp. Hel_I_86]TVZ25631.1 tRNA U34 5-methylaminomethyl-2-thiouridine-forming methyltransferase MnmC [Gillisia sp. Hel_I_86]